MAFRVSRAKPQELGDVFALDEVLFPGEDPPDGSDGSVWWIARDAEKKMAAYAGAYVWAPEMTLVMHRCGVHPRARGNGLQRRLIGARCAFAKAHGLKEVWTHTYFGSTVSSNNLIRTGFTLWLPSHWGGRDPLSTTQGPFLFWRKKL